MMLNSLLWILSCILVIYSTIGNCSYLPYLHSNFSTDFYAGGRKYIIVAYENSTKATASNIALHLLHPDFESPMLIAKDITIYTIKDGSPSTGVLYAWDVPNNLRGTYDLQLTYTKNLSNSSKDKSRVQVKEIKEITIHKRPLHDLENDNFPSKSSLPFEEGENYIPVEKLSKQSGHASENETQLHAAGKLVVLDINEKHAKGLFGGPQKVYGEGPKKNTCSNSASPSALSVSSTLLVATILTIIQGILA